MELRELPSVDELAKRLAAASDHGLLPPTVITEVARSAVERARQRIRSGESADPDAAAAEMLRALNLRRPRRVINATGVLLHTNLGRAPLPATAAEAGRAFSSGYGNVEFDLASGARGSRGAYMTHLLRALTGAEDALVVNNNAAALFLALAALAGGGNVVVSRGELIEIGGSFRLPELMKSSGARLVEVGTTNRTHADDYRSASDDAAMLLKVHPSNYRVEGFATEVSYGEVASLAREAGIPLVADVGSGLLDNRTPWLDGPPPGWLSDEPAVRQTLEAGADIVLFSGDKLLGGPQAGVAVGRHELIRRMGKHPIARAVRIDGATMAAMAATLELYAAGEGRQIPFWRMASLPVDDLRRRHQSVLEGAQTSGSVVDGESLPGAGTAPAARIPSPNIELEGRADDSWRRLLDADPPIVSRRHENALRLDLRTVDPEDDPLVAAALKSLA